MMTAFHTKNQTLVDEAIVTLTAEHPMTLRQLYYRLVSAGELRNDTAEYKRLGQAMTRLREAGDVPRTWLVDHIRATLKPSSWSGLADFADSVRDCYRKDFWASLPHHVEVLVEKDAIAGTIQPVTEQNDVALRVCRGYSSVSFAGEIADFWQRIEKPIFAYYRVSTKKQGKSGLGLEGQQSTVAEYVRQQVGKLVAEYVEVETGKSSTRPELNKALAHARRSKATLVVGKLDRLSRNVAFTSMLMESGVDFVACDNPHANRFTIHILAAVAEHEAQQISERTKAALAAAKRRGVKLGSAREGHWEGHEQQRLAGLNKARKSSLASRREALLNEYADLFPVVRGLRDAGKSLQEISDELNAQGHTTRRDKPWNRVQVSRVLAVAEKLA